ncbi:hypothetical protein [Aquimarina litoralis]|uniref:hypothetical protein n=1 Tax=Aquimarina litoralis TaxID=584605 RepID=UPI001C5810B4|nr:hypothetical protein [Aquimarina litoralis]MBW1297321.1 hypothetical protein [Aquimarina litoralis]
MKKNKFISNQSFIFLVIFFIGLITKGNAQLKNNINPEEMIGFACFFGGAPTKPVLDITKRLFEEEYDSIAKMLRSKNNAERYMAASALMKLAESKKYIFSETVKTEIEEIKKSSELLSICAGCTYLEVVQLKTMFSSEMHSQTENWLKKYIKN